MYVDSDLEVATNVLDCLQVFIFVVFYNAYICP